MSHRYPEIESRLRAAAVNFTAGNIEPFALALELRQIADAANAAADADFAAWCNDTRTKIAAKEVP